MVSTELNLETPTARNFVALVDSRRNTKAQLLVKLDVFLMADRITQSDYEQLLSYINDKYQ